jgi:hypothetical protein
MNDTTEARASDLRDALERRIGATAEQNHVLWGALARVIVAYVAERDEEHRAEVDELARHFPAQAAAMRIVFDAHIVGQRLADVGRCCTDGAS